LLLYYREAAKLRNNPTMAKQQKREAAKQLSKGTAEQQKAEQWHLSRH
jgi:hypothetical protein